MSKAFSKKVAAASGSGTMSAMWRSLAMGTLSRMCEGRDRAPASRPLSQNIRCGANGGRLAPRALHLADRGAKGPFQHAAALVGLLAHLPVAPPGDVAQVADGGVDGGQKVDVGR